MPRVGLFTDESETAFAFAGVCVLGQGWWFFLPLQLLLLSNASP